MALLVFLAALGRREVVTSHEARVAQTARVMAASGWPWNATPVHVSGFVESNQSQRLAPTRLPGGRDSVNPWLFPVINDAIRLQKPPLPYWATAIAFKVFGVSEFSARVIPGLLGALATLVMWDLGRIVLGSRRAAMAAAIVWVTSEFVVDEFRKSMADPYLGTFVLVTVWALLRAKPQAAWIALALGAMAKGPVVFVHVIPAIVCARIFLKAKSGGWRAHLVGAILFLAIVLPWPALILRESPELWRLWVYEAGGNVEKPRPWWLYLASSVQYALPWTPLWITGIVLSVMRRRPRRRLFALAWYLIVLIFFSCLPVKKDAYLLPIMPAQTLIIAGALITLRETWRRRRANHPMSIVLAAAQCAIGIGFAIGLISAIWRNDNGGATGIIVATIGLIVALLSIRPIAKHQPDRWLIAQAGAYVMLLIALIGFHLADRDNRRSSKRFGAAVSAHLAATNLPLLVTRLPEDAAFYLPLNLRYHPDATRVLVVFDQGRRDPPVDAKRLSDLLNGATVRSFERVPLNVDDGGDRYQLFDVSFDRGLASIMNVWEK